MPAKLKVKILSSRNLPVVDKSSYIYVEIELSGTIYKTDVLILQTLWNSEWFIFEVGDLNLQVESLQVRLMDHNNGELGRAYLNLNNLLLSVDCNKYEPSEDSTVQSEISGWIPMYNNIYGIRGEIDMTVKLDNISSNLLPGVRFFYTREPQGYYIQMVHGKVEGLLVKDHEKICTDKLSLEIVFFKLSGELQQQLGVNALNLGGNAVIGYEQNYHLNKDNGIMAKGIGIAVTLAKIHNDNNCNTAELKIVYEKKLKY